MEQTAGDRTGTRTSDVQKNNLALFYIFLINSSLFPLNMCHWHFHLWGKGSVISLQPLLKQEEMQLFFYTLDFPCHLPDYFESILDKLSGIDLK